MGGTEDSARFLAIESTADLRTATKGGVLAAAKAVGTQGNGSVFAMKAVGTQGKAVSWP